MGKSVAGSQDLALSMARERSLARALVQIQCYERAALAAMGALAAVIEEPYCILGAVELRAVVLAYNGLDRASGTEKPDYVFRGGCAVIRSSGEVLKEGINKSVLAESTAGESKNA
jgi:hypothetical protein